MRHGYCLMINHYHLIIETLVKQVIFYSVLQSYLPREASDEEIKAAVASAIEETGASSIKEMGTVMKATMAKLAGMSVDGKKVNEAVKASLS